MLKQIRAQLPPDPRVLLGQKLKEAVRAERYEEAAELRAQLDAMKKQMAEPVMPASREEKPTIGDAGMPPAMPKAAKAAKPRKPRLPKPRKADSDPE